MLGCYRDVYILPDATAPAMFHIRQHTYNRGLVCHYLSNMSFHMVRAPMVSYQHSHLVACLACVDVRRAADLNMLVCGGG